jgi:hypothetical protein
LNGSSANLSQFGQAFSFGRGRPYQLMDEHCPRETARPRRMRRAFKSNVIVHNDHFHRDALGTRHLGSQPEIEPVSGVIFYHQESAWLPRHRLDGGEYRVSARRSEHLPSHRGAQHARPDVARMCRLMAAAASREHSGLPFAGFGSVSADKNFVPRQPRQSGV